MVVDLRGNAARRALGVACAAWLALAPPAFAQAPGPGVTVENGDVQLDFNDVELSVVIDTIARLTDKNFIYDDRVRGRVTIVSPSKISVDEAYAVFESVLQVKGFTTVEGPGGAIKVIPIREAKESSVETIEGRAAAPNSDRFITRLIPLRYIDAEAITNTLKPLVSKDASMVAYPATNTVILTDAASNINRILSILRSIDVETYKEELTVIQVRHADAGTLASQLSEIFDADVSGGGGATAARPRARNAARRNTAQTATATAATKGKVRIITDERTNSLIVLASRQRMAELREVIQRLDVAISGGGRIHVKYLKHADAEELATTLSGLIGGGPGPAAPAPGGGRAAQNVQALRAAVTELSDGVTVTADAPTNSLVIQASQEGFNTLSNVIDQLDIARPQVLVEALIMEVDVSDGQDLGFNGIARIFQGDTDFAIGTLTDSAARSPLFGSTSTTGTGDTATTTTTQPGALNDSVLTNLVGSITRNMVEQVTELVENDDGTLTEVALTNAFGAPVFSGTLIQGLIRASASVNGANILSAPHILTMDNEEAEIKVGANIPIVTSRVESAAGQDTGLATSQNIERQDIGVTLRVTPQISEGANLRLKIFQEITDVNTALSAVTGDPQEVGVSLSNRRVENTVVVADNETVVIGGLISDDYTDTVTKVPWLGDIPVLGWAFKSTTRNLTKTNLLIFLTPRIVRDEAELAYETIRKREEFWESSEKGIRLTDKERKEQTERREEAGEAGHDFRYVRGTKPVRGRLVDHAERYPVYRMREIEEQQRREREGFLDSNAEAGPQYAILAATFGDEGAAAATLQQLIDAGYDGTLVSEDRSGTVLYEVRIGPFEALDQAEDAAAVMRESFELAPSIVVDGAATESE